jgi:hypothetical protein
MTRLIWWQFNLFENEIPFEVVIKEPSNGLW